MYEKQSLIEQNLISWMIIIKWWCLIRLMLMVRCVGSILK